MIRKKQGETSQSSKAKASKARHPEPAAVDTRLDIQTPNGTIAGMLMSPGAAARNGKGRLVLLLHGSDGDKDYLYQRQLAIALASSAAHSFRFDFRSGTGESAATAGAAGSQQHGFGSPISDDVDDLRHTISHLQADGWTVQALVGHSRGASAALRYCATVQPDGHVPLIVNVAGNADAYMMRKRLGAGQLSEIESGNTIVFSRPNLKTGTKVTTKLNKAVLEAGERQDILKTCTFPRGAAGPRVLTYHGRKDDQVPPESAEMFRKWIGPDNCDTVYADGADHFFRGLERTKLVANVTQWLAAHGCFDGMPTLGEKKIKSKL